MLPEFKKEVMYKVDMAVDLNRQLERIKEKLDQLKADLREAASKGIFPEDKHGNVVIRSENTDNCATIIKVAPSPEIISKDIEMLKRSIPVEIYGSLFTQKTVLSKTFKETFQTLPSQIKTEIEQYVGWNENDPRVTLSK